MVVPIEFFAQVPDTPDQIALTRVAERKALAALENHFDHVARLRRLNAAKSFFGGSPDVAAAEVQSDKRFIDLHPVFHEGDFQLFSLKPAAQSFKGLSCLHISGVGGLALAAGPGYLPLKEMRLVDQHRGLQLGKFSHGCACLLVSGGKIIHLESNLGEQKMRQYRFPRQR